jgi:hypothetical protein
VTSSGRDDESTRDQGEGTVHISSDDGLISAAIDVDRRSHAVRIQIDVSAGHVSHTAREDVLRSLFRLPQLRSCPAVQITVPLGESDLIDGLRARLDSVHARAAGASCLIDARPAG